MARSRSTRRAAIVKVRRPADSVIARRDKVARLSLASSGAACAIKSAALTAGGDAPTVKRAPAPKNVVFWITDDTRSDKFKLYNPKTRVETPVVDAFAKRATNFKVAYVQGNESRVSHASLWTSMYPAECTTSSPRRPSSIRSS